MKKYFSLFLATLLALTAPAADAGLKAVASAPGLSGITSLGPNFTNANGTLNLTQPINAQTGTSYAFVAADGGKLVTFSNAAAVAVTLSQANQTGFTSGYSVIVQNKGAGAVTITPTTSTIGGQSTLVLGKNVGCTITSDGTNYQVSSCSAVSNTGTFANRPTCGSSLLGATYFATDVGSSGVGMLCNGTKWKPPGGTATLFVDPVYNSTAITANTETNYKAYLIPGGLLSDTGSLEITASTKYTNSGAGTKTLMWRLNTTSGAVTGGTQLLNSSFGGTTGTLSNIAYKLIYWDSTAAVQFTTSTGLGGLGLATSATDVGGTINKNSDFYVNLNLIDTASDTVGYRGVLIKWND